MRGGRNFGHERPLRYVLEIYVICLGNPEVPRIEESSHRLGC